jgi:hypothetical protein
LSLLVLLAASPCAAQDAERYLVAPLGGDAPEAMAVSACDAVRATLVAEGFAVIEPADVATIAPARFADAHHLEDLRPIATELGATAIATVAVWTSDGAPSSVIVSIAPGTRSFSATETVHASLEESARDALRAALARRRDALIVGSGPAPTPAPVAPAASAPLIHDDSLFGIVGPGFLAALGAAGIGGGIYASLDETCDQRNPMTNVCLRGERPNYGLGVAFIAGGAVALAGAIVWWILGSSSNETSAGPRIDIVTLPGGGYVSATGRF